MKQFKTLVALVLALALTLTLVGGAVAEIKITLKSTATSQTQTNDTTYTYYELLKATIDGEAVAYYLDSPASDTLKGLLAAVTYENADGDTVTPFSFAKSADGTKWIVTVSDDVDEEDGEALAAALNTSAIKAAAIANNASAPEEANGTNDVEITVPNAGYYLIIASNGKNLVLQTLGDVTINEKNTYPPIGKTQADTDDTTQSTDDRNVKIGDTLTYNVTVTVPASAKVGDIIQVYDKATNGLTYNNDLATTPANVATATTAEEGDTWRQNITITEALLGKNVVFTFTMTVNSNALVDEGKENEAGLKYGNDSDWYYESLPVKVEYKTYYAGIHKIDGTSKEDLAGVKFVLKDNNGDAVNVTKPDGEVYYIPGGSSNEVETDTDGRIMIRGLDMDKNKYTLTETATLPGYNPLDHAVELSLYEDTYTVVDENGTQTTTTSFDPSKTNTKWGEVENNQGATLPSTGGIGTTIFYVAGIVLVLGAAAIIIARRKAEQN